MHTKQSQASQQSVFLVSLLTTTIGFVAFVSLTWIGGCAATGAGSAAAIDLVAQPKFFNSDQADEVDTIQIGQLELTDRKEVERFLQVCRRAKWGPSPYTPPAGKGQTIVMKSNGVKSFQLSYCGGWLIDRTDDGKVCYGTIHVDDGKWFDDKIERPLQKLQQQVTVGGLL